MSKIWVVMRRDYEYNDETYESQDGGNVVVGFSTEKDAQLKADELNISTFRDHGGYMYLGYESYDNFSATEELIEFLNSLGNTENEDRKYSFDDLSDYYCFDEIMGYLKSATDEEIMIFVDALENPEYYVDVVEVER